MKDSDGFTEFVLDQLRALKTVRARRMFGGYGLYLGDTFFGILYRGQLFFKVHPSTRDDYERRGMNPFCPKPGQTMKNYLDVPAHVVEDPHELVAWAREALH